MERNLVARRLAAYGVDAALLFTALTPVTAAAMHARGITDGPTRQQYVTLVGCFSLPAWVAMVVADASGWQTPGKRLLGLRVVDVGTGDPPALGRALLRTAVKLLPWELSHLGVFGLTRSGPLDTPASRVAIGCAQAAMVLWLAVTVRSGGRRGPHDEAAGTAVLSS